MATPNNQAEKFERERGRVIVQPPPPFPRLPEAFVKRYGGEPAVMDALNAYSDACQKWVEKYVVGQS